ncbi:uncharacterized protein MONOS_13973 [Monocercomonoides exilis]|uniref:uncharacterized protein n=1 Tax=Monocercomonoides exilis TaxID=2049356 RepID=UPI00355A11BD|nr:hypothetical protein MONOS_13973 [Monocercomonoides exilis]|eukprot:MONOS_13973.1-p1 / transcript=MONOS_13973.1 / gene=MONOS_13973 / organism=Monocercomonoides_exilis_PA203 / gene_product=unspecified product / transcript_product=unspecified product / location=Mono_scaffold00914:5841-6499(-) / protein_length=120 / sequence_SO=supercontig / SO=protein_coding / is_pseudo=false
MRTEGSVQEGYCKAADGACVASETVNVLRMLPILRLSVRMERLKTPLKTGLLQILVWTLKTVQGIYGEKILGDLSDCSAVWVEVGARMHGGAAAAADGEERELPDGVVPDVPEVHQHGA